MAPKKIAGASASRVKTCDLTTNMADEDGESIRKRRGRYREFLRHANPYKFAAVRRRKTSRDYHRKADQSKTISQNSYSESECVFNVQEVLCREPADQEQVQATDNSSPSDFCCYSEDQDIDEISQFEFEEDAELSDQEETFNSTTESFHKFV